MDVVSGLMLDAATLGRSPWDTYFHKSSWKSGKAR